MTATIIDGKGTAQRVRDDVAEGVRAFTAAHDRAPGLATVLVGEDPASATYVRMKRKACAEAGIESYHLERDASIPESELLEIVAELAADDAVDGILVQLPLPGHMDEQRVIEAIPISKDVDGFHPLNAAGVVLGYDATPQCTPAGVIELLDTYDVQIEGSNAVVVGRSNIVGKPLAAMLLQRNATVTVCHSRTSDLAAHTREADILIAAVGRAQLITGDMVKPGATVIDVGINRTDAGLVGDVDFESVKNIASSITPVPGGVGPMTIAMLMRATLDAAERRAGVPSA
jgi:methylenetetrahydrofolate dehydrogenase (NADP+)/methenyltetrahydrofolate cyclohydrolase